MQYMPVSCWLLIYHTQANDLQLKIKNNIAIDVYRIRRNIDNDSNIKSRSVLVDRGNEDFANPGDKVVVVPVDNSWHVVRQWQNAVFVDDTGMAIMLSLALMI